MSRAEEPCVSLYMPCHRAGRERQQNRIRYKNLVGQTEELLKEEPNAAEAAVLLGKLEHVLDNEKHEIWEHPGEGLALFAARNIFELHRLPVGVAEQVHVGERFYVRPILPLLQTDEHYLVLAASHHGVRLFEGTRDALDELHPPDLPKDLEDALNIDEYQTSLQYYSYKRAGDAEAAFHGHGAGDDDRKQEVLQYFRRLAEPLDRFLNGRTEPLLFAGVEYLFPLFKQAIEYRHVLETPLPGNRVDASRDALRESAWQAVQPHFAQQQQQAVAAFHRAYGQKMACSDLQDVLTASSRGAIETLLLRDQASRWGQIDTEGNMVQHDEPDETSLDLLEEAAYETLENGGRVFVVGSDEFPEPAASCAAVLRFPVQPATAR